MLGYVLAAKYAPDEPAFLEVAKRVSDWWISHVPADGVTYSDFTRSGNSERAARHLSDSYRAGSSLEAQRIDNSGRSRALS